MSSTEQRDIDLITAKLTAMTAQMLASIDSEDNSYEVAVPVFDAFIDQMNRFLSDPPFTRDALIAIIAAMASDRAAAEALQEAQRAQDTAALVADVTSWLKGEQDGDSDILGVTYVEGLGDLELTLERLRAFQAGVQEERAASYNDGYQDGWAATQEGS